MGRIQVFLDTDVLVSSLLSKTGASYEVIKNPHLVKVITKTVLLELERVVKRHRIRKSKKDKLLKMVEIVPLGLSAGGVLDKYGRFVFDNKDSHVVGGASVTKSKFLLTHNIKHYDIEKIGSKLEVIVLKPGNFLQYLRSISRY